MIRPVSILVALVTAFLALPAAANGAGGLYWTSFEDHGSIRSGSPAGSGDVSTLFSTESPTGLAVDPSAGKLYWSNPGLPGAIRAGNLDGTGSPSDLFDADFAVGVAIDRAAGKIYWANGAGTPSSPIYVGNLNGTGTPQVLFDEPGFKYSIAIDPAAGKIIWTNGYTGSVRIGNLDGSGTPSDLYAGEPEVTAVAVDPATGKVYWTDFGTENYGYGSVRVGNVTGTSPATTLFPVEIRPQGIAVSHELGKVYWASSDPSTDIWVVPGRIRVGNLDGSGYACSLYSDPDHPDHLAIDPTYSGDGPPDCPPPDCPKMQLHAGTIPLNGPPLGGGPKAPGVRVRLQLAPPSTVDLGVSLRYRLQGRRRTISFGHHSFEPEKLTTAKETAIEMRLPLPRKLRDLIPINRHVTMLFDVHATPTYPAKCPTQSAESRLKTRVKRIGLSNPITSR